MRTNYLYDREKCERRKEEVIKRKGRRERIYKNKIE